jgi:hypothetical protein
MNKKRIAIAIMVCVIIISLLAIALNLAYSDKESENVVQRARGSQTGLVGLYVEGGKTMTQSSNIQLNVEGGE